VINTGGEKVVAEEVEQALLMHPAVQDALIVGAPDERWGSRIVAIHPGAGLTPAETSAHVGEHLSDYERPRQLVVVGRLERSPSGKADLTRQRRGTVR
jgi:fatty-acyl-CoA synthase